MRSTHLTDAEIRALGWRALVDRLGVAGALRFARQTERGSGDYAAWRHQSLGRLSVGELVARARRATKRVRTKRPRKRRSA